MKITIPNPGRGRRSAAREAKHQAELTAFYEALLEIKATARIKVSARGWCYLLEEYGLTKGEFNRAETLINDGRKSGALPTDICSDDDNRAITGVEVISSRDIDEMAEYINEYAIDAFVDNYHPESQWENQEHFVILAVEKKDLVEIFKPVCRQYGVPLANFKGWADINSRLAFMRLFDRWEHSGKQCVLLYCGDHDPGGLNISDTLRKNLSDLTGTWSEEHGHMDWSPDNLIIDRFGLNYDFIQENGLSWVENLITGSGKDLASPSHADHFQPYVQAYLKQFGKKKVEANALVTRIDAGRELCRQAILRYIDTDALEDYWDAATDTQEELREKVAELMKTGS